MHNFMTRKDFIVRRSQSFIKLINDFYFAKNTIIHTPIVINAY